MNLLSVRAQFVDSMFNNISCSRVDYGGSLVLPGNATLLVQQIIGICKELESTSQESFPDGPLQGACLGQALP
jgi:hypothetical protein